jgi:hypothetical protein
MYLSTNMPSFSIKRSLINAWQTTERNLWFVIRLGLIGFGFAIVNNYISSNSNSLSGNIKVLFVFTGFALAILHNFLHIGFLKFGLRLIDGERPKVKELLSYSEYFWYFLFGTILQGVIAGAIFLFGFGVVIVLGLMFHSFVQTVAGIGFFVIIALIAFLICLTFVLRFMFTPALILDQNLGPIRAIKQSVRMTEGLSWKLLGFALVVIFLNIAGAVAIFIGLLITIPVSLLAYLYIYRSVLKTELPIKTS